MNSNPHAADMTGATVARRLADGFELTKPRVVLMILITAFVGFYVGSGDVPNYLRLFKMLFGTALAAAGTLALNQFMERETDALMERTRRRPIPDGRVAARDALWFGMVMAVAGLATARRGSRARSISPKRNRIGDPADARRTSPMRSGW